MIVSRSVVTTGFLFVLLASCRSADPPAATLPFTHEVIDAQLGGGDCKGLADIDGDGKLDAIAGSKRELAWYSHPAWKKSVIAPARQEFTTDMQVADMDGDGDPDVVAPDGEKGDIAWYENPRPKGNPAALWTKHPIGEQGDWAHDVEVADLNGDGKPDVLTRKKETFLWLQNASGGFDKVEIGTALPNGEGSSLADMNRDGRVDIVQNGYWLENPKDAARDEWRRHTVVEGWPRQIGVRAADLNGDDRVDVILGPAESAGRLAWYEAPADPAAGGWKEHVIDSDVAYLHTFQVADVDNNGVPDLVTAEMHQSENKRVAVYLQSIQSGGPRVWKREVIATTGSHNLRTGDIDGDGDVDILGANWGGPHTPLEAWMNGLVDRSKMALSSHWRYVAVDIKRDKWGDFGEPKWLKYFGLAAGNVDGRGAHDVASGRYFYRSPATGLAGPWERVMFPVNVDAMLMMDVDGNGRDDVIAEALPQVYWLKPVDAAAEVWKPTVVATLPPTGHGNGQGYALGQLVAGGKPEVILSAGDELYYLRVPSRPEAGEWAKVRIAKGTSEEGIAAGDIDGDGAVDVAGSLADGKAVVWFQNPGTDSGDWKRFPIGTVEQMADRIAAADLNGDGRMDVVVSEETYPDAGPASVFWFEQPAESGAAWIRHKVVTQYTTNSLDVADMTGDGVPDIITGEHRGTRKVAVWENREGGKSWTEHVVDTGKESHLGARTFDLDGDGKAEILSICWDTYPNLHLWYRPDSRGTPPEATAASAGR